jgi:hypothetical protein
VRGKTWSADGRFFWLKNETCFSTIFCRDIGYVRRSCRVQDETEEPPREWWEISETAEESPAAAKSLRTGCAVTGRRAITVPLQMQDSARAFVRRLREEVFANDIDIRESIK